MIVIGGENLIDFLQVEGDNSAPTYQANVGGGPYNCAKALGLQGAKVGYITPISTDTLGALLAKELHAAGVELLAERGAEPTSLAVVSLQNGIPGYQFYRENTAERNVTLEALNKTAPSSMQTLYLGSLALSGGADADAWAAFYCAAHKRGVFTALDPNIRTAFIHNRTEYLSRLDRVLAHTDLLKLSDEDLEWLLPATPVEEAADILATRSSAKMVIVTLGDKGAFALIGNRKITVTAAPLNRFGDTVGAGDTFMATLLARLENQDATALFDLDDSKVTELLTWAACAAAMNCEENGCKPPRLEELKRRMAISA